MESLKHLRCPKCKQEPLGPQIPSLLAVLELQAKRHGVEIECRHCQHRFIHRVPKPCRDEPIK